MESKKVLVITYYWPPAAGPGVQRFLKFCKYLPEFGWEPVVLTVEAGSYSSKDASLDEDIVSGLSVYKTKTFEPFTIYNKLRGSKGNTVPVSLMGIKKDKRLIQRLSLYVRANFFVPDARKGWKSYALKAVDQIMSEHDISAIITTGPPQSTHLIGLAIKKKLGIPWLADFRDPWTTVYYNKFFPRTASTERKDKSMEDEVLSHADAVVAVSSGLGAEFKDRANKVEIIYNGFDHEDIPEAQSETSDFFTLEYIGNLKPNQNPEQLWSALGELIEDEDGFKDFFRLNITGNIDKYLADDLTNKYRLGPILDIIPYVSHQEAVERMVKTSLLLFVVPEADNNHLIITGKLFEYMASKTPILSIGPTDGDAAKLLKEAERDEMLAYNAKDEIKEQILSQFISWKDGGKMQWKHANSDLNKFSRKHLTEKLGNVLTAIVS
ncbi:MAG TPA: glycosyl transferase family 1 [Flavobacteriales bacterium]|nr:glycosyl transferase family 1 [Flavobacteriales bacterium]